MEYLSVSEAARELGLTVWGVRGRIERGNMRAERLGTHVWAIPRAEVERWRALGRQKPGRKPKRQRAMNEEQDHGGGDASE
jgi:excisionase family DNA binding protein